MSELVLEDWILDFSIGEATFIFAWGENHEIKVECTLDFDTRCEWKYFNGRDYEECTPVADIYSYTAYDYTLHHNSGEVMSVEISDINKEDEEAMQAVIDEEYPKFLKEVEDAYY